MTTFNYTWTVLESNDSTKNMMVEYCLEGFQTMLIGMPLPTETVSLQQRVTQYAPIALWEYSMISPISVAVGTNGSSSFDVGEPFSSNVVTPSDPTLPGSGSSAAAN